MKKTRLSALLALLITFALVSAACGSSSSSGSGDTSTDSTPAEAEATTADEGAADESSSDESSSDEGSSDEGSDTKDGDEMASEDATTEAEGGMADSEDAVTEDPNNDMADDTKDGDEMASEDATAEAEGDMADSEDATADDPNDESTPDGESTPAAAASSADAGDALVIWADERKVAPLQAIAPKFTEQTGVEVKVETVEFDQIRDQVIQAGPAGEGPDLFTGAHDWTGELAASGVIDPVDLSGKEKDFEPVALEGFVFEGQNYALPTVTEAIAMYRNTDLVADAPKKFDDIKAACEKAKAENCVVLPGGGTAPDAYHNYPFVSAYGGYIFKQTDTGFDANDIGLDSSESVKGVNYLADQAKAEVIPSVDYDTAKNLFLEGKAAFWITGPWELGTLRDQSDVNWDVSLIPQIGDKPTQPFVGVHGFFASSFSEKKLLAQSFLLDFMATDETMQALYDADPRGTAWVKVQEGLSDDPQVQTFGESASNGVPMPNISQMGAVWGPLGDNLLLVRNGEATGDEAMKNSAEAVEAAVAGN